MKEYNITPPKYKNYCLVSVIQAILRKEDIYLNQKEISKKLKPIDNMGFKIQGEEINSFFKQNGFKYEYYWIREVPFNEPDFFLQDMYSHHGIVGINKHAQILSYIDNSNVIIIDPNNKEKTKYNYYNLIRKMNNEDGGLSLIQKI